MERCKQCGMEIKEWRDDYFCSDGILTLSENAQDVYVPGIKGEDGTGAWVSRFDIVKAVNCHEYLVDVLKAVKHDLEEGIFSEKGTIAMLNTTLAKASASDAGTAEGK
jgi:hypothetical protein